MGGSNVIPDLLKGPKQFTSSVAEQVDLLNNLFCDYFTVDNCIQPNFVTPIPVIESVSNVVFTPNIVLKVLKQLKPKFSAGCDGLPPVIFKKLAPVLSEPLSSIFNSSFYSGTVPHDWLCANVIPIYKNKGKINDPSNYRPISLTSVPCKIMEHIIYDRLYDHFSKNNFFSANQHGFLRRKSTVTQLLSCVNRWSNYIDSGCFVDVIYLDLAKAFDSVCHAKLLSKLSSYGVCGNLLNWLRAFLSNRKQRVLISDTVSDWKDVKSGVPQGSVLGPLLFLIYVNDMFSVVANSELDSFADDTKVSKGMRLIQQCFLVQIDLDKLVAWFDDWQLSLNADKCCVLHIGYNNPHFQYRINNNVLKSVTEMRDLGITISSDLSSTVYVKKIKAKASSVSYMFSKVFSNRNVEFMTGVFKTYIRPLLEYATPVWSPHKLIDIDLVESVQRSYTSHLSGLRTMEYARSFKNV